MISRTPTTTSASLPGLAPAAVPQARDVVFTYEGLDRASNALAHSLRDLGVAKGDRVAVSLGNCAEFAALTYAVFKLGAVLVPLNPSFGPDQVAAALAHLGAATLVTAAVTDLPYKPCRGRDNEPLLRALLPDLDGAAAAAPRVPSLRTVVVVDNSAAHPRVPFRPARHRALTPFSRLLEASDRPVAPDAPLAAADTVNVQFTSGTTSQPKAAMLDHTAILNNGALIAHRMGLTADDRIVCPPPLFHCFGSVLGYMATATTGAALLLPSPAFDPAASLKMAADHAATGLYGVSTMFVAMLEVLSRITTTTTTTAAAAGPDGTGPTASQARRLPTHLRTGIVAGSSVPDALMRRLFASLGLRDLVICYGQTETSPVSCMTTPADPLAQRTASVGRAMPHTRLKVVDPADPRRRIVPRGVRGELAAAGYLVMQGYWGDEARTRAVRVWEPDEPGADEQDAAPAAAAGRVWMYSGDEAVMDADGYVAITGRIKDLIIRAGENIQPLEVENCLFQHPLVAEASVVGVPDATLGEAVGVFVVVHEGVRAGDGAGGRGGADAGRTLEKDDVRDWVRARLSGHLVPKYVFWVDEYPKTASGKIQKFKLREMAREAVFGPQGAKEGSG